MRRFFVIFLILLFPLNVLALSMSVSATLPDGASVQVCAMVAAGDAVVGDANPDIDPDEPPTVGEPHDFMNFDGRLQLTSLHGAALSPHVTAPDRLSLPPPDKPPRLA